MNRFSVAAELVVGALSMVWLAGCGIGEHKAEAQGKTAGETPTVAAAKTTLQNLSHQIALTAEFIPFQGVDLMAKSLVM